MYAIWGGPRAGTSLLDGSARLSPSVRANGTPAPHELGADEALRQRALPAAVHAADRPSHRPLAMARAWRVPRAPAVGARAGRIAWLMRLGGGQLVGHGRVSIVDVVAFGFSRDDPVRVLLQNR